MMFMSPSRRASLAPMVGVLKWEGACMLPQHSVSNRCCGRRHAQAALGRGRYVFLHDYMSGSHLRLQGVQVRKLAQCAQQSEDLTCACSSVPVRKPPPISVPPQYSMTAATWTRLAWQHCSN